MFENVCGKNVVFGVCGMVLVKEQFMICVVFLYYIFFYLLDYFVNVVQLLGCQWFFYIDMVCGFLFVFMVVNYIVSDLYCVIDYLFGFMSVVEGFVFMVGLMVGYVYICIWLCEGFVVVC